MGTIPTAGRTRTSIPTAEHAERQGDRGRRRRQGGGRAHQVHMPMQSGGQR